MLSFSNQSTKCAPQNSQKVENRPYSGSRGYAPRLRKMDNIMNGEERIMLVTFFLKVLFYFILFVVDLLVCLKYGTSKNIRSFNLIHFNEKKDKM